MAKQWRHCHHFSAHTDIHNGPARTACWFVYQLQAPPLQDQPCCNVASKCLLPHRASQRLEGKCQGVIVDLATKIKPKAQMLLSSNALEYTLEV